MKKFVLFPFLFLALTVQSQTVEPRMADPATYLSDLKTEMQKEWYVAMIRILMKSQQLL